MRRRLIAAAAILALLAVPAAALAQSAGDEQYADPFGDVQEPGQDEGTANESPALDAAPPAEAPAAPASTTSAGADSDASGTLPRTGFPAALSALVGALLLGTGVSMRRHAQSPVTPPPWLVPATSRRGRFGARRRLRR
jgi:hypothetical protein